MRESGRRQDAEPARVAAVAAARRLRPPTCAFNPPTGGETGAEERVRRATAAIPHVDRRHRVARAADQERLSQQHDGGRQSPGARGGERNQAEGARAQLAQLDRRRIAGGRERQRAPTQDRRANSAGARRVEPAAAGQEGQEQQAQRHSADVRAAGDANRRFEDVAVQHGGSFAHAAPVQVHQGAGRQRENQRRRGKFQNYLLLEKYNFLLFL